MGEERRIPTEVHAAVGEVTPTTQAAPLRSPSPEQIEDAIRRLSEGDEVLEPPLTRVRSPPVSPASVRPVTPAQRTQQRPVKTQDERPDGLIRPRTAPTGNK